MLFFTYDYRAKARVTRATGSLDQASRDFDATEAEMLEEGMSVDYLNLESSEDWEGELPYPMQDPVTGQYQ